VIELGRGAIDVHQVLPIPFTNGEIGVVFVEIVTESRAVGRPSPKNGSLAGGVRFPEERPGKVLSIQFLPGNHPGEIIK
jgi:hypothetical protein